MKHLLAVSVWGLGAALAMLSGCDDGDCGKVQPCGGDVVGSWKIAHTCVDQTQVTMNVTPGSCPGGGMPTLSTAVSSSGNATYNADMTFSETITTMGSSTISYPPTCLTQNGITYTCPQVDQLFKDQLQMNPDPTVRSVGCAEFGANCNCTIAVVPQMVTRSGTYSTSGTTLSQSGGGAAQYCVQGNNLHLLSVDTTMSMGMMGQVKITADIVFEKQ